jgi:hypothetical protein
LYTIYMNIKKILLTLGAFIFLFSSNNVLALQEAHIFVPNLTTDKLEYAQGETIKAQFEIDNNSNLRQSDVTIVSSLVVKIEETNVELNIQKQQQALYLEANSRLPLSIEHIVDANINGPAEFVVSAFLKDGSLVGQKRNTISILNSQAKPIIVFDQAYVDVNSERFPLQAGPTVSQDSAAKLVFTTAKVGLENILIQPKIELYDRTEFFNEPVRVVSAPSFTVNSNQEYSLNLPVDLNPKVYEGKVLFESNEVVIPPLYFRYILEGPIGTIINVNASKLSVKKGEIIQVLVEYAGTPPVINIEEQDTNPFINEEGVFELNLENIDIESLSDEEFNALVEKSIQERLNTVSENQIITNIKARLNITLIDENGDTIGSGTSQVSLDDSGTTSVDIEITKQATRFSIVVEMVLEDGTLLSSYTTELPSEQELQATYGKTSIPNWMLLLFVLVFVLLLFLGLVFIKKRMKHYALMLIIPLIATVGSFVYVHKSNAFKVEFASQANGASHFKVNAIFSPGPSTSVSYAPGEEFKVSLNASYIACRNAGFTNSLFGPSDDWSSFNLNGFNDAFQYQQVVKLNGRYSVKHINVANYFGDGWGPILLPRYAAWWSSTGQLPYVPYQATIEFKNLFQPVSLPQTGFYMPTSGKRGFELWKVSNVWGTSAYNIGNERASSYSINPSKTYSMPTTPGNHTFYFLLLNNARGGTASVRIVSQTVCVRGAGVCVNEGAYNIVYNANESTGGSVPTSQSKFENTNLTIQGNTGSLVKTGSVFVGWNTQADGLGIDYLPGSTYSGNANLMLYAKWVPATYTITYDRNNATSGGVPSSQTKNHGANILISNNTGNLERINFSFAGWNTQADGKGLDYPVGAIYGGNANLTLFAKWNPQGTYTLNIVKPGDGNGIVESNPSGITCGSDCNQTYSLGTSVILEATPSNDSEFIGWSRSGCTGTGTCTVAMNESKTVEARFSLKTTLTPPDDTLSAEPQVNIFTFNPRVADANNLCPLSLTITNVKSCTITNRATTSRVIPALDGAISITADTNEFFSVGTYTLSCIKMDDSQYNHSVQAVCSSNPDITEI